MYGKTKANQVPSDQQAREKLAMYVYEYLLHVGAEKAASLFLQEIGWEKSIAVKEPPGFLHSWWCVFWDLYCASPERRDTCEHSTEAKAFHDYSFSSAPPLNAMPTDGMNQGISPGYFPPGASGSPSHHSNPNNPMMRQPFAMSPRYPPGGPRPGMQAPGPQPMLQGMDHPRQGQMMGMGRMVHPRGMPPGSMNPYGSDQFQQPFSGVRMPASTMPGHSGMMMGPMSSRSPWPNPPGPSGTTSGGLPATPMMRSPPDQMNPDYGHMGKPMPHQMPSSFPMSGNVPEGIAPTTIPMSAGPGLPVSTPTIAPGLNGMNGSAPDSAMMDGLAKGSPSNNIPMNTMGGPSSMAPSGGPGETPRTPQNGEGDSFNMATFNDNDQSESAEILKIKETMQQEAKRFETKETDENEANGFGFLT